MGGDEAGLEESPPLTSCWQGVLLSKSRPAEPGLLCLSVSPDNGAGAKASSMPSKVALAR